MLTGAMRTRKEIPEIHVLAVDDGLIDRKVIEKLLKDNSFKVTTVESAARALEVLGLYEDQSEPSHCHNDLRVSMILTDYCMPGMTGYELLKKVKETKSLEEIPVVIMSSDNMPQRIKRCLAEGAEDFIIKPVQPGDIQRLRKHIKPVKRMFSSTSTKRKVSSGRLTGKDSERRPRFSRLTFA